MTAVADVLGVLEHMFPSALADEWDVVGLAVGDPSREVTRVHFAVDPTRAVVDEAARAGAQLIVTHHPLMLRGVTSVAATTSKGAVVHALIEASIALFCAHTNADAATGGVSDALARAIGLTSAAPLIPHAANPTVGIGRIGSVAPTTVESLAADLASALPATAQGVLFAGEPDAEVKRVALVGGAGDSYIDAAAAAGADAFVTADLRHHPVLEARELATLRLGKPALINVSHAASESLWLADCARLVSKATGVEAHVSTLNTDPWTGHIASPRT
jgi:dinuclear metal center YbgI/SA1388 family protein